MLFSRPRSAFTDHLRNLPAVTLIVSAFNERAVIETKVRNALALDYEKDRLEIVVVSDCSHDGTDDIVSKFSQVGVRLIRQAQRLGKSEGLNLGVAHTTGDVIVFSDANAIYDRRALLELVKWFALPRVGYVVGQAKYAEGFGKPSSAESEGLYWRLETWLKQKESDFGSVVGGDGAIYAIRRHLFSTLLPTDINDFLNPLQIIARGYRGVYEPRAICIEEAGDSFYKEFRRKVRIVSRSLNAVGRERRVLLPWVQPRHWFALISHKLLRWFVPVFLIGAISSNFSLLGLQLYRWTLAIQLCFYVLAALGWIFQTSGRSPKLFYLPYYFCVVNLASLIGIAKAASGTLSATWQTVREHQGESDKIARLAGKRQ